MNPSFERAVASSGKKTKIPSRKRIKELFKAFQDPRSLLALFVFLFSLLSELMV
jgi:hypothetical protein